MVNQLLNAAEIFRTIGSVLLAIIILLVMITIHEFGHYLAGKIFHFKINEFSIGFGPALFKRISKKTGEQFSVRLIPLGGYCAFEGEDGVEETVDKEGKPAEGVESTDGEGNVVYREPHPDSFTKKPPWQRIIVLIAGALMNYLLALLLIIVNMFAHGQMMTAVYEAEQTDAYAAEYCVQDGDIFLQAEGKDLYLSADLAYAINGKKQGDTVNLRISRIVGKTEDGKNLREERDVKIMLRSDVAIGSSTQLDGAWKALGIKYVEEDGKSGYMLANSFYRFDFFQTIGHSFVYSFKISGSILQVIGELFTGKLGLDAFGGPITTITMTSQIASMGLRYFLEIAGYIGVNLAVFNLLPIPALDGSKVIFTLIEWVRGKPVNRKVEAVIHFAGIILLLGFAVLVDLLQLF